MIRKVRIVDIHPLDAFYEHKNYLIGKVATLDLFENPLIVRWYLTSVIKEIHSGSWDSFDGAVFYAVKVEDVNEG